MRKPALAALILGLATFSLPAAAQTVDGAANAMPSLPLKPPVAVQPRSGAERSFSGHRFASPPRPGGWHWGGNGWWGGSYRQPMRGYYLPSFWLDPYYTVSNWGAFGLRQPGLGLYWVRYYDDAVLVDQRGIVRDSVTGIDWERYERGAVPRYVGPGPDRDDDRAGVGYGYHGSDRGDRDEYYREDRDEWEGGHRWRGHGDGAVMNAHSGSVIVAPPGSVTTIVIQSQPVVTTTTTYYYEQAAHRAYAKPKVRHRVKTKAKPRCVCR